LGIDEVKVNSVTAWLDGRIYAKRVTFDNSAAPVVGEISVSEYINSALIRTSWWDVFLPKDPEGFVYDADGNLTLDGVWEYTWVAESRLRRMEMRDSVAAVLLTGSNPWVAIDFAYDWMGRRIGKTYQTSTSDPATSGGKYGPPILWMISRDTRYVYDGWMLSMSYKSGGSSLADQSFAWGPDLSGGYGGAGGIGGLVAYTDDEHDALNPSSLSTDPDFLGPQFPIYDGNGNVVKMVRFETAGSGAPFGVEARESASYEYGPFGENRSTTGELGVPAEGGTHQGQRNPFRFSTKFTDAETGLLYYGYRYYSPSMGRWINRDPIGELDDSNLYRFSKNGPIHRVDPLGLSSGRCYGECAKSCLTRILLPIGFAHRYNQPCLRRCRALCKWNLSIDGNDCACTPRGVLTWGPPQTTQGTSEFSIQARLSGEDSNCCSEIGMVQLFRRRAGLYWWSRWRIDDGSFANSERSPHAPLYEAPARVSGRGGGATIVMSDVPSQPGYDVTWEFRILVFCLDGPARGHRYGIYRWGVTTKAFGGVSSGGVMGELGGDAPPPFDL